MFHAPKWTILIQLYLIRTMIKAAVPIHIVTEKIPAGAQIKFSDIISMIPDKEPLINRRWWWFKRTTRRPTWKPTYLKYIESDYVYDDEMPKYMTVKPGLQAEHGYILPPFDKGPQFGARVQIKQVPHLLQKVFFGGLGVPPRIHPDRGFSPPKWVQLPRHWDSTVIPEYVRFTPATTTTVTTTTKTTTTTTTTPCPTINATDVDEKTMEGNEKGA